jgi:hypothetical protein
VRACNAMQQWQQHRVLLQLLRLLLVVMLAAPVGD